MEILLLNVKRNAKLFFKDKGLFFTSLITPLILLVLYATFLGNVYKTSLEPFFTGVNLSNDIINGCVAGQLLSSLLAVSCITVSFCSNMLMVQDKFNGARKDMLLTPIKRSTLALGYYISTTIATLIICYLALGACLVYVAFTGWFYTFTDVLILVADVFILTGFGTALSSVVNFFLKSQGQVSAVGSIVSSCYGFISGAYMPMSSFSVGLRNILSFLPGTYGTSLVREHALNATLRKMAESGLPSQAIEGLKDSIDANLYFSGDLVSEGIKYAVMVGTILLLIGVYVLLNVKLGKKNK